MKTKTELKIWTLIVIVAAIAFVLSFAGCSDAAWGKLGAYGDSAHITCYSGGKLIYDGESTGKVISESSSDGYFFKDKKDGKLKEVSGNCVIAYK